MMQRGSSSIVPSGFQCTAHSIFFEYLPPCVEINIIDEKSRLHSPKTEKEASERNADYYSRIQNYPESVTLQTTLTPQKDHCSICLSAHTNPVTLVSCCHSFCRDCALIWFRKKTLCPLCKSPAKYFVQSNAIIPFKTNTDHASCNISNFIKIWAIYEDLKELKQVPLISRALAAPAIQKHVERFVKQSQSLPRQQKLTDEKDCHVDLNSGHNREKENDRKRNQDDKNGDMNKRIRPHSDLEMKCDENGKVSRRRLTADDKSAVVLVPAPSKCSGSGGSSSSSSGSGSSSGSSSSSSSSSSSCRGSSCRSSSSQISGMIGGLSDFADISGQHDDMKTRREPHDRISSSSSSSSTLSPQAVIKRLEQIDQSIADALLQLEELN